MQLSSRRMASHLCLAFQNLVQCVQSLSGVKIIPANPRKKSASMLRLGFEGKILTSFPIRPVMQKAHETMTYVYQYIVQLNGAKILKLPLDNLVVDGILDIPHWEYETNAATRYRNYLKLRRIRKKHDDWICVFFRNCDGTSHVALMFDLDGIPLFLSCCQDSVSWSHHLSPGHVSQRDSSCALCGLNSYHFHIGDKLINQIV